MSIKSILIVLLLSLISNVNSVLASSNVPAEGDKAVYKSRLITGTLANGECTDIQTGPANQVDIYEVTDFDDTQDPPYEVRIIQKLNDVVVADFTFRDYADGAFFQPGLYSAAKWATYCNANNFPVRPVVTGQGVVVSCLEEGGEGGFTYRNWYGKNTPIIGLTRQFYFDKNSCSGGLTILESFVKN